MLAFDVTSPISMGEGGSWKAGAKCRDKSKDHDNEIFELDFRLDCPD